MTARPCLSASFSGYLPLPGLLGRRRSRPSTATLAAFFLLSAWAGGAPERYLYVGLLVWGVSFGGHNDTVLIAPGVAVPTLPFALSRLWKHDRRRATRIVVRAALAFVGGFAVYLVAWVFQDSRDIPHDFMRILGWMPPDTWIPSMDAVLDRFIFQETNQEWRHAFFTPPAAKVGANVTAYIASLPELFTPVGVSLIPVGLVATLLRRPRLGLALLLTLTARLVFWLSYDIGELPKHLPPRYLSLAVWVGMGVSEVLRLARWTTERIVLVASQPPLFALVPR